MRQINRFSVMAAIVSTLAFASCADDVYDPERGIQTEPKDNPLGADFAAPDGFDWSMINAVNLNVQVKDEWNGNYEYLIEVFTNNPISNKDISPIAVGVANKNKNYTAEINISKAIKSVFIRQTDPRQRKEVYEYIVPENGGALNCKLYYEAVTTKAMSRAAQSAGTSGWDKVQAVTYTEQTYNIPTESATISGNQLPGGSAYVIKAGSTYKGVLHCYSATNATIYVQGTWDLSGGATPQGVDIIVLNGGKIIATSGEFMVSDKSSLTIQSGGLVQCNYLTTAANVFIKNFGTLQAKGIRSQYYDGGGFNTGTLLFNAAGSKIEIAESFILTSAQMHNQGEVTVGGDIKTNNTKDCVIANYDKSTIKAKGIIGGATIINNNLIEVENCENSSEDIMYNNCTFIAKQSFRFRNVILNKGSITGGRDEATGHWLPVSDITTLTDANLTLIDGSFIHAIRFDVQSGNVTFKAINNTNEAESMIKAQKVIHFAEPTHVSILGRRLVIEGEISGESQSNKFIVNESVNTAYSESKYPVETCGGILNEGNEGEEPSNPQFPIEVEDNDIYTFAFEDNWPVYGDFDMNDLILTVSGRKITVGQDGFVASLKMFINLRAVGATKNLGAGIRFTKLSQNIQLEDFSVNGNSNGSFEAGQNAPTYILFTNAHTELWGSEYTDAEKRMNTIIDGTTQRSTKKYNINMKIPASAKVKPEDVNINNIDLFIITAPASQKGKRTEVHVAGFAPTELGGTQYFQSGNDNSSATEGRYYLSKENLAWAIVIPQEFAWPTENTKITTAYDKFQPWITSGGQQNKDWYKSYSEKNVYPINDLTPVN